MRCSSGRRCPALRARRVRSKLSDWWGSCAPRAGVAFDRVLVYATGGLAYTEDNTGWVVGGGVEWALPVNWFGSSAVTFGLEGLWVGVDRRRRQQLQRPSGPSRRLAERPSMWSRRRTRTTRTRFFVARAKLNFKFGTY